jgi:hypothetical protein
MKDGVGLRLCLTCSQSVMQEAIALPKCACNTGHPVILRLSHKSGNSVIFIR